MQKFLFYIFFICGLVVTGQKTTSWQYIELYRDLAIKEMERTGIPASITMAQGMLESGNGNSSLAVKANNHFGIKCHNWNGAKIYHDDDRRDECFRKYKSVYQSYKDHSDFLTNTSRYEFLFDLKATDYKEWAKGLKKAGYATARDYDRKLIKLIEDYKLYNLDKGIKLADNSKNLSTFAAASGKHIIEVRNDIKYILAKEGDTYYSLTKEFDLLKWQLARYNEISEGSDINPGTVLYLQPKRNKAAHGKKYHIVKEGENMYYISQKYGVKLGELYRKNLMIEGSQPAVGDKIYLRKRKKGEMPEKIPDNHQSVMEFEFE